MPCLVCGFTPVDVAHVRSKGAGGGEEAWNLMPLCRMHHREQHSMGFETFLDRYQLVKSHLQKLGWEFQHLNGRFIMTNDKQREKFPKMAEEFL